MTKRSLILLPLLALASLGAQAQTAPAPAASAPAAAEVKSDWTITGNAGVFIDFVRELYKTRRVSDKTYKRAHAFLGDAGVVELVGICGYYALISMTLNVFRAEIPADMPLPFKEP